MDRRQTKSNYQRMLLFKCSKFDCYLLRFTVGSHIKFHIDTLPIPYEYHRVNIVLKKAGRGGKFICSDAKRWFFNRIIYFRPDYMRHLVTKIKDSSRYVLSIGWSKIRT